MLVTGGERALILDLPGSRGREFASELGADKVRFEEVTVAVLDQVEGAMSAAHEAFGLIDLLAICAGISPASIVPSRNTDLIPLDEFRRAVDIKLNCLFDVLWRTPYSTARCPGSMQALAPMSANALRPRR